MTSAEKSSSKKMAFGNSVHTLIDIYSNCISLLKAFKRRDDEGIIREDKHQAQLRKSLKEDRTRVRRAYSSAVSVTGSRFEKGDERARSSLSRVLKKLKAAITNLMRSSSEQRLDYESLQLLSNASRTETLRTFDQLSRRLGSTPSRTSVASSSSSGSKHRRRKASSTGSDTGVKDSNRRKQQSTAKQITSNPKPREKEVKAARTKSEERKKKSRTPPPASTSQPPKKTLRKETSPDSYTSTPTTRLKREAIGPNRISYMSIATDSTKLGEIPERKWTSTTRVRKSESSDDLAYYNVTPVYPLKPYEKPVKERRFLGLFRRGS